MVRKKITIETPPEYRAKAAAMRTISLYALSPASRDRMLSLAERYDAQAGRSILPPKGPIYVPPSKVGESSASPIKRPVPDAPPPAAPPAPPSEPP
jgi:hypothetical protein